MKKTYKILAVLFILCFSFQSIAQVKIGLRAGLNLANMYVKDFSDADGMEKKANPTYLIGGAIEYYLDTTLTFESGLFISGKGTRIEGSVSESGITLTQKTVGNPIYLEIPFNAVYKVEMNQGKFLVFAGPYVGFGIAGKGKTEYTATGLPSGYTLSDFGLEDESVDIKFGTSDDDDLKGTDFGFNFGIGWEQGNIQLRAQYGLGLSNLDPAGDSDFDTKNRVIGISLGVMFGK